MNNDDYIDFGDICRSKVGLQCQYGVRYLEASGARYMGDLDDYHFVKIHRDDVEMFIKHVKFLRNT
jgi:hypothetical protein